MLQCTLKRVEFCYLHIELVKLAFEQIVDTSAPSKTALSVEADELADLIESQAQHLRPFDELESIERVCGVEAKAAASPGRFGEQAPALIETQRVRRQAAPRGNLSDAIGVVGKDHNHVMNP